MAELDVGFANLWLAADDPDAARQVTRRGGSAR
jgi:hypothetical protein